MGQTSEKQHGFGSAINSKMIFNYWKSITAFLFGDQIRSKFKLFDVKLCCEEGRHLTSSYL